MDYMIVETALITALVFNPHVPLFCVQFERVEVVHSDTLGHVYCRVYYINSDIMNDIVDPVH